MALNEDVKTSFICLLIGLVFSTHLRKGGGGGEQSEDSDRYSPRYNWRRIGDGLLCHSLVPAN